ncbi:MAG: DUF4129 domain-containing protein [Chloroflexi bacterium]|nr:DUF4129 domain-containing protein [Chloroflexota bacterium]
MNKFRAYVRRELVFLALASMEACAVASLVTALILQVTPIQPSLLLITEVFLGALLIVHYIARASLQLFPLRPVLRSSLLGLGMLLSGLFFVHQLRHAQTSLWDLTWLADIFRNPQSGEWISPDLAVFLLVLFVWWRGVLLAQRRLDSDTVISCFRSGMIMLAITTIASGYLLPSPPHQFVFAFFFVSLLGIALARAEEVGQRYGGSQSPFSLGWLATVVAASLGVLILAAGVATLLTGENLNRFLGPIWEAQQALLTLLLYVLLFLMSGIMRAVMEFLQSLFVGLDTSGVEFALDLIEEGELESLQESAFSPGQLTMAKTIGVIFVVLILLLLITLSVRRMRARAGRRHDEYRESVWEGINMRGSLSDLLNDGRRRLGEMADALNRSRLGQMFVALTIRRIYAHLGALAAELGHPRALHETPYEYQPSLEQAFPDSHEQVAQITQAYIDVHYGQVPDQMADLQAIRTAWEHVQETALENSD